MRKSWKVLTLAVAALSALTLAPAAANAEPVTLRQGFDLVGFDEKIASQNGYEVVTLPDGRITSVPVAQAEAARRGDVPANAPVLDPKAKTSTDDVQVMRRHKSEQLSGLCGLAFVELRALGGRRAEHRTGFIVSTGMGAPAVEYSWLVEISDTGGTSYRPFAGPAAGYSWTSPNETLHLSIGVADALIVEGRSWARLGNGAVCWARPANAWDQIN